MGHGAEQAAYRPRQAHEVALQVRIVVADPLEGRTELRQLGVEPGGGIVDIRQPAAVGRPGQVGWGAFIIGFNFGVAVGFEIVDKEPAVVIGMGEFFPVRAGNTVVAQNSAVLGDLFRLADAVGGDFPEFRFSERGSSP